MANQPMEFRTILRDRAVCLRALLVDGEAYFDAADVASCLGYARPLQFVAASAPAVEQRIINGEPFLTEEGVHTLGRACPHSRRALARALSLWVIDEIAPALRPPLVDPPRATGPVEEDWASRLVRVQALTAAAELCKHFDLGQVVERVRQQAEEAVQAVLLPEGDRASDYVDACQLLCERGCSPAQAERLASELGKDLALANRARAPHAVMQQFGAASHAVARYHRVRDAGLLEDVLRSFQQRRLYLDVMGSHQSRESLDRLKRLEVAGRGRM